jgi:hypothetical protein
MPVFISASLESKKYTPQEEVVISGISGYFPQSGNVYSYKRICLTK